MRIREAKDAIASAHPELSRKSISRAFDRELKFDYTIEQTKARVEQSIYAEGGIKLTSPTWSRPMPVSTHLPQEMQYHPNAATPDWADPTGVLAVHVAGCKSDNCGKCEEWDS